MTKPSYHTLKIAAVTLHTSGCTMCQIRSTLNQDYGRCPTDRTLKKWLRPYGKKPRLSRSKADSLLKETQKELREGDLSIYHAIDTLETAGLPHQRALECVMRYFSGGGLKNGVRVHKKEEGGHALPVAVRCGQAWGRAAA